MPEGTTSGGASPRGSDRDVSTTMVFVQMLTQLLKDKEIGK